MLVSSNYSPQELALCAAYVASAFSSRWAMLRLLRVQTPKPRPRFMYRYYGFWRPISLLLLAALLLLYFNVVAAHKPAWLVVLAIIMAIPIFLASSCYSLGEVLDIWDALNARVRQRL